MNTTTDGPRSSGKYRFRDNVTVVWLVIAVLAPAGIAFWILHRQQFSLPYQDDYGAILEFASEYHQLPSLPAKLLHVATQQDNDYKLGFAHSIIAMEIDLTGHLNFGFLITFGNLFLLAIAYLLWRIYRREELSLNRQLIQFLPISLLFFSLTYWETLNWAMASLQNLPVIFFSLLSIYLLIPQTGDELSAMRLVAGCIAAILASMSSANGFLLGPIGLFILWRRRALVRSVIWCVAFLVPVAAYLYHYHPYQFSVGTVHNGAYVAKAAYFLAFLGCAIQKRVLAALAGLGATIVFGLALWDRFDLKNPRAFYSTVWVVMTAALVGFLRQTIASRYSIYSLLVLIFCYSFLVQFVHRRMPLVKQNWFSAASVLLGLSFCLLSDKQANLNLKERRQMVVAGMEHYRADPEINAPTINPELLKYHPDEPTAERIILNKAIHDRIYSPALAR